MKKNNWFDEFQIDYDNDITIQENQNDYDVF